MRKRKDDGKKESGDDGSMLKLDSVCSEGMRKGMRRR